jgi:hypothetical protein
MRRLTAAVAALLLSVALLVSFPTAASAACPEGATIDPVTGEACIGAGDDGTDEQETPGDEPSGGEGTGEPECIGPMAPTFCSGDDGWIWSDGRNCYLKPYDPQPAEGQYPEDWHPPLLGKGEDPGAWYQCALSSCMFFVVDGDCSHPVWIEGAPPTITPGEAAQQVFATLNFRAFQIGMAPRVNPEWGHRRTHVGVPVWMWVADRGPETYDGNSVEASAGGLSVSGRLRVSSIEWSMGDGSTVVCGSPGQAYQAGFGWRESPDCGHVYSHTSDAQPGDRYGVTATTRWVFDWSAGGTSGSIETTTTSTTEVEVNELQTVNTSPAG